MNGQHWESDAFTIVTGLQEIYFGVDNGEVALNCVDTPCAGCPTPSPVSGFNASDNSCSNISLSWTAYPNDQGVDSLFIDRAGTPVGKVLWSVTSFVDNTAPAGTYTYNIRARYHDDTQECYSAPSSEAGTRIQEPLAPADTSVQVTAHPSECGKIIVRWRVPIPATSIQNFIIYQDNVPVDTIPTLAQNSVMRDTVVTSLSGSHNYSIRGWSSTCGVGPATPNHAATAYQPPAQVTGLTTTNGLCTVNLSWGAVTGATSYIVRRNGTQIQTVNAPATSYSDGTATPNTPFNYTVAAFISTNPSSCQEGAQSTQVSGSRIGTPTAPSGVNASDASFCSHVQVTWWDNSSDETGFVVRRNGVDIFTTAANVTSYNDSTATGTPSYTVAATNTCGTSSFPTANTGSKKTAPSQVTGLTATNNLPDRVTLTWGNVANETGFGIYRDAVLLVAIDSVNADVLTYDDTSALPNTAYNYQIGAYNECGTGTLSTAVQGMILAAQDAPTNVSATDSLCDSVVVTWDDVANETKYRIVRDNAVIDSVTADVTTYTDHNVVSGAVYSYVVRAVGAGGTGDSDPDDGGAYPLPVAPGFQVDSVTCDRVYFSFIRPAYGDTTHFYLDDQSYAINLLPNGTFSIGLDDDDVHTAFAVGSNECGYGSTTDTLEFQRLGTPAGLTDLSGYSIDCQTIVVSWTSLGDATDYNVYLDGSPQGSIAYWLDSLIIPAGPGTHDVYFESVNACGVGDTSNHIMVEVMLPPSTPQNVTASDTLCTGVSISWEASDGDVDGYDIYRDDVNVASVGGDELTYVDDPGDTESHDYTVVATSTTCPESDPSDAATGRQLESVGIPTILSTTDRCDSVIVCWSSASGDVDGYYIYVDEVLFDSTADTCYAYVPELHGAFSYMISAYSVACGEGDLSDEGIAGYLNSPVAPPGFTASEDRCDAVALSWGTQPESTAGVVYHLYRDDVQIGGDITDTTYVDTEALLGDNIYTIYAIPSNDGCDSSGASITTGTVQEYPTAPTNVMASDTSCSDVFVTWEASTGTFSHYIIFRDGLAIDTVGADTLDYTDTGIASGTTAAYTVRAYDELCGSSDPSDSDNGTRLEGPEPPINVTATDDNCDSVMVAWNTAPGDVTEYRVYRDDNLAGTVAAPDTMFTDIPAAGVYEYTVRAYSEFCGLTNASDPASGERLPQMGQVTGVVASVDSCEGVYITWEDYPGATSYIIYRDGDSLTTTLPILSDYADFTVVMGESHDYTVAAVNACNEGPQSVAATGMRAQTPTQVMNLTATQNVVNEVCLSWDNVAGELGFYVYRNATLIFTTSADDTSYCDMTAVPGVEYTYTVAAYNVCGEGDVSTGAVGIAVFNLDAVTGVEASTTNCNQICLTWTDIDNETGYEILREGEVIGTVGADVTTYCDATPEPGECFTYTVRGFNEGGAGEESEEVEGCRRDIPGMVSTVAATTTDCDAVTVSWTDIENEDSYQIWREGAPIATVPANSVSYDDETATPGQFYNYWVVAVNECGSGDVGNTAEGAIADVPPVVAGVAATMDVCSLVTVTWTDQALETGYNIYRDGNTTTPIATVGANVVSYNDNGITGVHTYQVAAFNACGVGPASVAVNGEGYAVPGVATGVTAVEECGTITVSWTAPATSPITGYSVWRNGTLVATNAPEDLSFVDGPLPAGSYSYRVITANQCGAGAQSAPSNTVTVIPMLAQVVGFTAVASPCFCVDMSWNDVANEQGYYIFCNGVIADTLGANVTSTQFCPADTGNCNLTVAAFNGCEVGPESQVINVTPNTYPVAVVGFAASENLCDMVQLTWTPYTESGVNYLRIRRNGNPLARVAANTTTYNHPGIWPASTYSITALRVCAAGDTIESPISSDQGRTAPTPVAPSQMSASDDGCGIVTVSFTFANVDGQDSVQIKRNGSLLATLVGGSAGVQRQYVDSNPLAQAATYEVCAVSNLCGVGGCASDAGVAAPTAGTVTNLAATHDRCTSILLTWTGTQHALNYEVRKGGTLIATLPQGTFSYTDNVATGSTFNYTVAATNACGSGPQTPAVQGSTIPLPPAPTGFNASDGLCNVVIVSWNEVAVATEYQIWRNNVQIATVPDGLTSYNDTDIQPGVVYNYQMRGVNQCGLGTMTAVNQGSSAAPVSIVTNVVASTNLNDRVHLSWNNVSGETGFEILRGFPAEVIATVGANVIAYDDFSAAPGVEYEYRVRAFNDCGQGAMSVVTYGYRVPVDPIPFGVVTVTTDLYGCMSAVPADLDDDGDMDVVACGMFADKVMWYENMGGWQFVPHVIVENWDGARSVAVGDLDNDGDLDIAAVAQFADQLVWFRQNQDGSFTLNVIASNYDGARDVVIVDLDGDNDMDLVTAACDENDVSWWRHNPNNSFTRFVIDNAFEGARSVEVADIGNDGDMDILGAAYDGGMFALYSNNGSETFTRSVLMSDVYGASYINAAHLNGDNVLDIYFCVAQEPLVAWWDGATMEENYVTSLVPFPREMDAVDMDADGLNDLLLAANENQEISWWRRTEHRFYRNVISSTMTQASVVHGGDFDNDGDTDIIGAGEGTIKLWLSALTDENMDATLAMPQPEDDNEEWPTYSQTVIPVNYELSANYPNPFNPTTQIQFGLPEAQNVQLTVYDITGREVTKLVDGSFGAGYHTVTFDASSYASGVYLYRIVAGSFVESRKMILMK
ncbi:MAG: VCBS repeat-containing protein [Calditrichaeota bacterium]|nr:VCBS repeat-containing protein [Calditrichota bacterium]MCB9368868.1 VCBS repeat-containing protein [Calditrichota bacterium]